MKTGSVLVLFSLVCAEAQKEPNFVDKRTGIVNLFEWKWSDVAEECERYLKDTQFGGVQISPPNENLVVSGRPWAERYQPVSYILTTRSGTESEFKSMVSRCNQVGIRIYADVILNHMAASPGTGTAGSKALSDLKTYPASNYTPEHFHPTCEISNYLNPETVRICEFNHSPDLDQSNQYVRDTILKYLNNLIQVGVAGFRIDSAKYMWPEDLEYIYSKLTDLSSANFPEKSRPFFYQNVPQFDLEKDLVEAEEYTSLGVVEEPNYGSKISKVFAGNNLSSLPNWESEFNLLSSDTLVSVDTFKTQRNDGILNYKTIQTYKAALSFMLAYNYGLPTILSSYFFTTKEEGPPQGINGDIKSPIIYSDGSCGNGYVCEHRWPLVQRMIKFRSVVLGENVEKWWINTEQQIAFSRGKKGAFFINYLGDLKNAKIPTSLASGTYCDVITGELNNKNCTGKSIIVDGNGVADVTILDSDFEKVIAIHVESKI